MSNAEKMVTLPLALLNTAVNGYVQEQGHALNEIRARLAQLAQQDQGEPVAWLYRDPDGNARDQLTDSRATEADRGGWLEIPLYTHADPAEVDRLRYKAELYDEVWELATSLGFANATTAISILRAQLAEAQALLRDIASDDLPGNVHWNYRSRASALLSASAEPEVKS